MKCLSSGRRASAVLVWSSLSILPWVGACSGSDQSSSPLDVGGATGTGGVTATGGGATLGGAASIGGINSAGGSTSTGGNKAVGGTMPTGGFPSTGGSAAVGGVATVGGTVSTGGTNAAGGTPSTGGTLARTGGAAAVGGATPTGGMTATGGVAATGGAKATGGTAMTGGVAPTGGSKATGGAAATGGATGTGGSGTTTAGITCTPQTWDSVPIGWATVSGGTTGGGNATPTVVTTLSQLNAAVGGTNAAVIHVSGKISGIVSVGSNKTILGLCGAEIDGSIDMTGSSNVIMRNLKIVGYNCSDSPSDCSAGHDAVHVQGGDQHLWFDHLDISDGSDGNMDITHACDYITVSWTKFHYTGRTDPANAYGHMFANLIGHSDSNGSEDTGHLNVTFHHCWWADHVEERTPRVRFGKVHVFNSLYTCSGNQTAIAAGVSCNIRDENNVFVGVNNPIDTSNSDSASIVQSFGNTYTNCSGSTANMGGAAFTPTYAYALDAVTSVQAAVQSGAGPK